MTSHGPRAQCRSRTAVLHQIGQQSEKNKTSQRNIREHLSVLWWYECGGDGQFILFCSPARAPYCLPVWMSFLLGSYFSHCTHVRHSNRCTCGFNKSGCQAGVCEERPKPLRFFPLDTSPNESKPAMTQEMEQSLAYPVEGQSGRGKRGLKMLTFTFPKQVTR